MNKYGEITLCNVVVSRDAINQAVETLVDTQTIQCVIDSIGRSEWLIAQQGGYQAEIVAKVFAASYNKEPKARYNGKLYVIYRTYQDGDSLELYLGERIGELHGN